MYSAPSQESAHRTPGVRLNPGLAAQKCLPSEEVGRPNAEGLLTSANEPPESCRDKGSRILVQSAA